MRDRRARTRTAAGLVASAALIALVLSGCAPHAPAARTDPARTSVRRTAVEPDTGRASSVQDPAGSSAADSPEVDGTSTSDALPVRIRIPSIGVDASLLHLARGADGVLAAPPSTELDKAGWYAAGTVPGRTGPAVIAGHVDWVDRVAVFHRLGELRAGARIDVVMSGGSTVSFTVDRTESVSKLRFPTKEVYGPTPDAQLRVITCGGPWDDARDIYSENVIVFATETSQR